MTVFCSLIKEIQQTSDALLVYKPEEDWVPHFSYATDFEKN